MDPDQNQPYIHQFDPLGHPQASLMPDMTQHVQTPPQQTLYFQQDQQAFVPMETSAPVNFATFQPDPNVAAFQGQPYPPQLNILSQNPMPLLPTEPLPINPQLLATSEKKKTATKQTKRKSSESATSPGSFPFKKIPEYVHHLLEQKNEAFTDVEFAERALSNLARKLASQTLVMEEWTRAIYEKDIYSGCVCVPRPKDGRMTITKATGSAGCKKVFPQILVCQLFRFPNIVFHHDIKSSAFCQHPGVIKPPQADKANKDDSIDETKEVICVNPYHYDLTPEAEARFKKQLLGKNVKAVKKTVDLDSSFNSEDSDDEESDDEILNYEDDGVDYAKLWDESAIKPKSSEIQEITMESLLKEIQFFTLNKELKTFSPAQAEYLEKLGVFKELENVLKSGDYKKMLKVEEKLPIVKPKTPLKKVSPKPIKKKVIQFPKTQIFESEVTEIIQTDKDLMPPPAKLQDHKPHEEDEDNAIQNLLDDIRGSFERQFDDEFNDLTETNAGDSTPAPNDSGQVSTTGSFGSGNNSTGNSRASSPFANINIGPTFSMSDGQVHLEDLAASAEDLLASSPDEMPLEGWTMSQEVFDNFLEAAATSGTEQDHDQFNYNPGSSQQF